MTILLEHHKQAKREIIARFDAHDSRQVSQNVLLALDMSRACLFDATTQRLS